MSGTWRAARTSTTAIAVTSADASARGNFPATPRGRGVRARVPTARPVCSLGEFPLRHDLTSTKVLVSEVVGGGRVARIGRLSLVCHHLVVDRPWPLTTSASELGGLFTTGTSERCFMRPQMVSQSAGRGIPIEALPNALSALRRARREGPTQDRRGEARREVGPDAGPTHPSHPYCGQRHDAAFDPATALR